MVILFSGYGKDIGPAYSVGLLLACAQNPEVAFGESLEMSTLGKKIKRNLDEILIKAGLVPRG